MSAAGWTAKQSLVAQTTDKTAEKTLTTTVVVSTLTIAALGVADAAAAAAGIAIGKHLEE